MTTPRTATLRSAAIAWLKGQQSPAARVDEEATAIPADKPGQSRERTALAALFVGSLPAGLAIGWLVNPVAAWVTFGLGVMCLIAYLLVGALSARR